MTTAAVRHLTYLSGTRADFGLMRGTLRLLAATPGLRVDVVATGMHLDPAFGHTVDEIAASGLQLAATLPSDVGSRDGAGMARALGQTLIGLTAHLQTQRPDALLLLGDRGEMLAGAIAALHLGVPSVHIHGGERSGTVDEPVRHAIAKLASYHFTATAESRERLIAMGELADHVFEVGAPGLDDLDAAAHSPRSQADALFGLPAGRRYALVAFHPVVQQAADASAQTAALIDGLSAVGAGRDFDVIWMAPNADAGSAAIERQLDALQQRPGWRRLTHLGRDAYLVALRHADALLGNSSSGIIEAASFATPVINVGARQRLRQRSPGTVDVEPQAEAIAAALRAAIAVPRGTPHNVYGDGRAGPRIARLLATLPLHPGLLDKANRY